MKNFKFPLATTTWDQKEIAAINQVMLSNQFSMGDYVRKFEQEFATYLGSQHCVMVNSGSSANLLMVAALFYVSENALKRGDEVIVPAVSWSTSYFPLYQYGLKIKFVDIDLETLNFDLDALRGAVTDNTKLIFAVNLLGNPNNFDEISEIIADKEIRLLEDNCESMGATFNGKMAGTFGCMGSFSTYFSHHIATMEGGVICTDDEELFHILLSLRSHGWTRHLPEKNHVTGSKSNNEFEESFKFVLPGYNVRPLEMSGAIGLEQLKKLPEIIEARRRNANLFTKSLDGHGEFLLQKEIGNSSWFGFSLIIREGSALKRTELLKILDELSIECRPIVSGNFAKNEVCRFFDYTVHSELKNAEYLDQNGLFIGNNADKLDGLAELILSI